MSSYFDVEVELEVVCDECGGSLEVVFNEAKKRVMVRVCEVCLERASVEGYDEGYLTRKEEG